ncbi:MAG: hypothetical protein ACREMN_04935 [Gemmatimonadales bacterium]
MYRSQAFASHAFVLLVAALVVTPAAARAQAVGRWVDVSCDLRPGHGLVNRALGRLRNAANARVADQRQENLDEAQRALAEALTAENQGDNPATWYYLGRYYLLRDDAAGADSAFTRAEQLKPDCAEDIATWRRMMWVPLFNAGVEAAQTNNPDSALRAFRRASLILRTEPVGFQYPALLHYNAGRYDSAIVYFRKTADAAGANPQYAEQRKDALYNLSRLQHGLARGEQDSLSSINSDTLSPRWTATEAAYREYLALYPNDAEILASLGNVLVQMGKRDSAFALYREIIARADSVGSITLFRAGVEIYQSAPPQPDTTAAANDCRAGARRERLSAARIRARCDSVKSGLIRDFNTSFRETYGLAEEAFTKVVEMNPHFRDGLFTLVNTKLLLNDTTNTLATARRLVAQDPLNRESLRLLAFTYQQAGDVDSTLHYLRMADSTLVIDVTVNQFEPDSQGASLQGIVTNPRKGGSPPTKLVFEFLDRAGQVVATQTADIPAIQPQQSHPFELKPTGVGIQAWRYRRL